MSLVPAAQQLFVPLRKNYTMPEIWSTRGGKLKVHGAGLVIRLVNFSSDLKCEIFVPRDCVCICVKFEEKLPFLVLSCTKFA